MSDDVHPVLQPTAADHAEKALRALTSAIDIVAPGAGSLFGELIEVVIPNTKADRLDKFITRLARRLAQAELRLDGLAERLGPQQVALFEEGARSATRATEAERIDRLARIVAYGFSAGEAEAERSRTFVDILDQLSEVDLLTLDAFCGRIGPDPRPKQPSEEAQAFMQRLQGLSEEEAKSVRAEQYRALDQAQELGKFRLAKLLRLGLLDREESIVIARTDMRGNPVPEMRKGQMRLSRLGQMVLSAAGLGQSTWEEVLQREAEAKARFEAAEPTSVP